MLGLSVVYTSSIFQLGCSGNMNGEGPHLDAVRFTFGTTLHYRLQIEKRYVLLSIKNGCYIEWRNV